jgi:hypothetical protein
VLQRQLGGAEQDRGDGAPPVRRPPPDVTVRQRGDAQPHAG